MKKFFKEFKTFITRGNVVDMAVGVIIGGAFTAIVTALTDNILKPIINWVIWLIGGGKESEPIYTFLVGDAQNLDKAIYIDWGAFISGVINFILIALVLFLIIKAINKVSADAKKYTLDRAKKINEYRKSGLSRKEAIAKYEEELALLEKQAQEEALAKQKEAELKATENTRLLAEIRDLLKK